MLFGGLVLLYFFYESATFIIQLDGIFESKDNIIPK